ncbi:monocarboxylate transporter 5-like [Haliotis rubra]|uniref:monocarboxylate transporter 5-like n=1 Tax=Haliotis rubra TaxID=36100 RepID=UPI001EE5A12E|nr:monocarboxylate transporter 5-like [Haliotis rubra]
MKRQTKDIDRGYAWVVCGACFAMQVLCGALNSSPGVITPAILEEVDGDLVKVSWVGSTLLGTFSMCGPLAGIIQDRIGNRWTGILGGILMFVGLTAASFCRTVTGLILTFGVIAGLGCGLAANVSGVAPSNNFNKRLQVAYGICMSGGGVGLLVIGPLAVQLLEMYRLSGALLILGAIACNVCLAGALIRPLMQEESMSVDLARQEDTGEICDAQGDPTMTMQSQHNVLTAENTTVKSEQRDEDCPGRSNETAESLSEHTALLTTENSRSRIIPQCVALFCTNGFFLYLLSILFWSLGDAACMVHLPNFAELRGSTPAQSASLFTVMGVPALCSGLLAGFASSDPAIGNIILHVGLLGMTGVSLLLLPVLSHTYSLQMIFSALYGTYSQGPFTLVSPICIELIGRSKLAVGYGICSFFFGLGNMVGPIIASLIYKVLECMTSRFFSQVPASSLVPSSPCVFHWPRSQHKWTFKSAQMHTFSRIVANSA